MNWEAKYREHKARLAEIEYNQKAAGYSLSKKVANSLIIAAISLIAAALSQAIISKPSSETEMFFAFSMALVHALLTFAISFCLAFIMPPFPG